MEAVPKSNDFGTVSRYSFDGVSLCRSTEHDSITCLSKTSTADDDVAADADDALMASLAAGDDAAARAIVDQYLALILALARRMLGDQSEAEDVAQDTFARAWAAADRWEPGRAKLSTWLHRIAMNLCLDRLRKKRPEPLDPDFDAVSDGPDPEMQLAQRETAQSIDRAIQALPERQRAAIVLSHYQYLSNTEAAGILNVSVEALESLLARGRRSLRASLRPEWNEIKGVEDARSDATETKRPERAGQ